MRKMLLGATILALATGLHSGAQAYPVLFATGNTNGTPFNAAADGTFQTATNNTYVGATFQYSGPLSFRVGLPTTNNSSGDLNSTFFANGTITDYSPFASAGVSNYSLPAPSNANFSTLATFLGSSASAYTFQYGSILAFDLGTLSAGTVLTIDHDDGASVYQGDVRVGNTTAGPTGEIIETVRLASTGQVTLVYARENGAPSVLGVAVPEPATTGLLGAGLVAVGLLRRRRASV